MQSGWRRALAVLFILLFAGMVVYGAFVRKVEVVSPDDPTIRQTLDAHTFVDKAIRLELSRRTPDSQELVDATLAKPKEPTTEQAPAQEASEPACPT